MKHVGMILGLVLLVFAGLWYTVLRDNFNQRFPDGWSWVVNSLAYSAFASETGQFPEGTTTADEPINESYRAMVADSSNAPAGLTRISDHYETRDPQTGTISWQLDSEAIVDPRTGQHAEGAFIGQYYLLPQNLDKATTYIIANAGYHDLPLTFQAEEQVNGINVYRYGYVGDFDNSLAYPPETFPDLVLPETQTIICFGMSLEFWVEPNTGEILKFREWCEGDYVVDTTTNERLYGLTRWGAETDGADLIRQAAVVQAALLRYQIINLYVPLGAAVIGLILLLVAGYLQMNESKSTEKKVIA